MVPKKVLVLGGRGFIGRAITGHLSRDPGLSVHSIGSAECDLRNQDQVLRVVRPLAKAAHLVMCSAVRRPAQDEVANFDDNVGMCRNLVAALANGFEPHSLVFLSSTDVYGRPPATLPMRESGPISPTEHYGLSKYVSERLLSLNFKCPVAHLRLPGIYGPDDAGRSIIGALVKKMVAGETVSLDNGGADLRDYYHVQNVAEAVACLIKHPGATTLNLATGQAVSIAQLVTLIGGVLNLPVRTKTVENRNPTYDFTFDVSKLNRELPQVRPIQLAEGVLGYRAGQAMNQ